MRNRKILQYFCCFILSFIFVNMLTIFYYSNPRAITNREGYSVSKHKSYLPYSFYALEGFGRTVIDAYGFNNDGTVKPTEAKVVCIGSSQTEALHVDTPANYVSVLNEIKPQYKAYNLGVSGQYLNSSLFRLPLLPHSFHSCRVIVTETPNFPSDKDLDDIIKILESNDVPINDLDWKDKNLAMKIYRRLPFATLLFSQISRLREKTGNQKTNKETNHEDMTHYSERFKYALRLLRQRLPGMPVVIVYLPIIHMEKDGRITIKYDEKEELIRKACQQNDIVYISMGSFYQENYEKYRILPYGFWNSGVGTGHLNVAGHRMVAGVLKKVIEREGWIR